MTTSDGIGSQTDDGIRGEPVRMDWGQYTTAIRRWENILGRPAPYPTKPGRTGRPRLAAEFVEWLMGLPHGWVTGVPGLSRAAQLRALGNGVIPAQAATALSLLLQDTLTNQSVPRGGPDTDSDPDVILRARRAHAA